MSDRGFDDLMKSLKASKMDKTGTETKRRAGKEILLKVGEQIYQIATQVIQDQQEDSTSKFVSFFALPPAYAKEHDFPVLDSGKYNFDNPDAVEKYSFGNVSAHNLNGQATLTIRLQDFRKRNIIETLAQQPEEVTGPVLSQIEEAIHYIVSSKPYLSEAKTLNVELQITHKSLDDSNKLMEKLFSGSNIEVVSSYLPEEGYSGFIKYKIHQRGKHDQ